MLSRSIGSKASKVDAETLMTAWEGAARQTGGGHGGGGERRTEREHRCGGGGDVTKMRDKKDCMIDVREGKEEEKAQRRNNTLAVSCVRR